MKARRAVGRLLRPVTAASLVLALSTCAAPPAVVELGPAEVAADEPVESPEVALATVPWQEWQPYDPPPAPPSPPRADRQPTSDEPEPEPAPIPAAEPAPSPTAQAAAAPPAAPPATPTPSPTPSPAPPVPAPEPSAAAVARVAEPTRVVIPRIGVNNPMTPVGLHPDRTLVVPDEAKVAGWYTGAPRPGRTGPSVVVGHNTWKGSRGVFWDLRHLQPGDEIQIHHDDGSVVAFAVEKIEQYPKDAFPTQKVYGNTPRREIRVITCGGVFDQQRRSHRDNIVVYGVRIR
jgi:sortase (surface protein transpeptidase)